MPDQQDALPVADHPFGNHPVVRLFEILPAGQDAESPAARPVENLAGRRVGIVAVPPVGIVAVRASVGNHPAGADLVVAAQVSEAN